MPTLTYPVQPDGLLVPVIVGLDGGRLQFLRQSGQPLPRPVQVCGDLDTGADVTAVSARVLQALGISPSAHARTHTAAGPISVMAYEISLSILPVSGPAPPFTATHLIVTELAHTPPGIDVLVGLDVILQGVLHIDGPGGTFSFTF